MKNIELYNDNCFNIFPQIQDKYIDLFVLDLPYANFKFGSCTACKWDIPIDLDEMWKHIKRIMKPNATIVFFCNTKFGYALIDSNPKWFKYDLIWKKSRKVGFLSANKQPLRQHENIYIFDNKEDDIEIKRNLELRAYSEKVYKFIGKSLKNINKDLGHRRVEHFFYFKSSQFGLPILETYNELIEKYKINKIEGFIEYDILKDMEELTTYNPQKIEGKEYKSRERTERDGVYIKDSYKRTATKDTKNRHPTSILPEIELEEHENVYIFNNQKATYNPQKTKGKEYKSKEWKEDAKIYNNGKPMIRTKTKDTKNRHPTSILPDNLESTILQYNNPHKTIHRTQKPEKLLEWLIKTYSNEKDIVMDFTMGSGTTGVACKNLNRKFIGVEMDKEIYDLAYNRINDN
tara:strand:- start:171 stop:1382 length:1212 start_codon:yes stop_codon:yes gene_type:complete